MSKALSIIDEKDQQVMELVTQQIARGASAIELKYFIAVCNRMQLDPFAKQIWAVKRWDSTVGNFVMGIQTGIDGFRAVANRSGLYEGQTAPMWCGEDGVWKDIWTSKTPPFAAKVGVYRQGFKEPIMGIVHYESVVQLTKDKKPNAFWGKMPAHMLAKCAEAQALRKAFPNECGGIYSEDEMIDDEPELAEPGKRAEARMNRFQAQQEKMRDVSPTDNESNKPPVEDPKVNEPFDESPQQGEPKARPRNMAHENYVVKVGPLCKWPTLGRVPENEAKKWIFATENWREKHGGIPDDLNTTLIIVKEFWGLV